MSSAFFEHRKAKKNGGAIDGFDHRRLLAYLIAASSTQTPVVEQGIERARNGEPMTRAKAIEVLASASQDFREAAGHLMRARINPRREAHCRSNFEVTRLRVFPDEPTDVFSPEWDRDLQRLLVQADQRSPRSHPGTPRTDRESRKIRVRIFRGYMLQLFDEARRILRALKLIIITSETDRSDLASAVFKLQILFAVSVISVEVKLALYRIGWVGIDASSLTGSLSAIRAQLLSSVALAQPAQARHQI